MHTLLSRAGDMGNAFLVKEKEGVADSSLFSMDPSWTVPLRMNGG